MQQDGDNRRKPIKVVPEIEFYVFQSVLFLYLGAAAMTEVSFILNI